MYTGSIIRTSDWERTLDDDNALRATFKLNDVCFHALAIRVHLNEKDEQVAVSDAYEKELEAAFLICGAGPFETAEIDGFEGDYAIILTPFAL